MNHFLILASSAAFLSASAVAGTAATTPAATDAGPVIQNSQAMAAADQMGHPMNMRQQIQDQLTKDGYSAITVTPSSFFVRAKDKAGNPVAMVIGPDSFTEVTDVMPKTAATGTTVHKVGGTDDPTPVAAQKVGLIASPWLSKHDERARVQIPLALFDRYSVDALVVSVAGICSISMSRNQHGCREPKQASLPTRFRQASRVVSPSVITAHRSAA